LMRHAYWMLIALAVLFAQPVEAADLPQAKGLWLVTDYPAITAQAGQATTVKLKVENGNLPPERVDLAVEGVPQGWRATLLGGGAPIGAAMPATNGSVPIDL